MTLAELRTLARQRADMENSAFVSDAEANTYVNLAYSELYDLLVSSFEDYYVKDPVTTFTLTSSNQYTLPIDFYKLRGLDFQIAGDRWIDVRRFNFAERNTRSPRSRVLWSRPSYRSYRIMGGKLIILPEDNFTGQYRMWYTPRFVPLTTDAQQMGDVLDFEEYVVIGAAIMMLTKEESDTSTLMMQKQAMIARVEALAKDRDTAEPDSIANVRGIDSIFDDYYPGA